MFSILVAVHRGSRKYRRPTGLGRGWYVGVGLGMGGVGVDVGASAGVGEAWMLM